MGVINITNRDYGSFFSGQLVTRSILSILLPVLLVSLFIFSASSVQAGVAPKYIKVSSDRQIYVGNETITISGQVEEQLSDAKELGLEVYNPDRQIYLTAQVPVNTDRTFSYSFIIEGERGISGDYEYRVSYPPLITVGSTFVYIAGPYQLEYDGKTYLISYRLVGELASISVDAESKKLLIVTEGAYQLEIELPRVVIDSKAEDNSDSEFLVLVDGKPADFQEIRSGNESRTILIETCKSDAACGESEVTVTVIGTSAIPEFNSLPGIIGTVSIAIIVITFRSTRLRLPKGQNSNCAGERKDIRVFHMIG